MVPIDCKLNFQNKIGLLAIQKFQFFALYALEIDFKTWNLHFWIFCKKAKNDQNPLENIAKETLSRLLSTLQALQASAEGPAPQGGPGGPKGSGAIANHKNKKKF